MYQRIPRAGLLSVLDGERPFQAGYASVVVFAVGQIKAGLGTVLHSLYLSGEVARREAAEKSDIELTLMVTRQLTVHEYSMLSTIKWRIEQSNQVVKRVLFTVVCRQDAINFTHIFRWGFFFKHCAICVEGENIASSFGHFEVSWEVAKAMNADFARCLAALTQKIVLANKVESQLDAAQEAAKCLIKASFGLVAHKQGCWEENLQRCSQYFLEYYPEKQQEITRLFYLLDRKPVKKRAVLPLLTQFTIWLQAEYRRIEHKIG